MSEGVTRADCDSWCSENRHGPDVVPFQLAYTWPDGVSSLSRRSRGIAQIRTDSLLSCYLAPIARTQYNRSTSKLAALDIFTMTVFGISIFTTLEQLLLLYPKAYCNGTVR